VRLFALGLLLLAHASAQNTLLRTPGKPKPARTDQDRIKLVLEQLAAGAVITPEDKCNAALVLDHTGLTFRGDKLESVSPDNYLLAHYLAQRAFAADGKTCRGLVAATIDRYLGFTTGQQKYGTNRIINQSTGNEELFPIDRATPDSERAKYAVPPLADLLKKYPEAKRPPSPH
jgi:hypothetical protein